MEVVFIENIHLQSDLVSVGDDNLLLHGNKVSQ